MEWGAAQRKLRCLTSKLSCERKKKETKKGGEGIAILSARPLIAMGPFENIPQNSQLTSLLNGKGDVLFIQYFRFQWIHIRVAVAK